MKTAVIGSRDFKDYEYLKSKLDEFEITEIISGGAKGADSLAERYARENDIPTKIFYPDWDEFGISAGFIRNKTIIDNCEMVIAFWDGKSKGTKNSIDTARVRNKQVTIFNKNNENIKKENSKRLF